MAEVLASDLLEDDANELAAEQLVRGTRLGRYELLVPIAKGGMARVWAARQHGQRGFTKLVAVKTILPHLARDAEFERMFLDEARIASLVQHPNVCTIYELGEEGAVLYLAMEWVHGSSLAHMLRPPPAPAAVAGGPPSEKKSAPSIPLEPRIVARIVSDACAGLNAAHNLTDDDGQALGVVHRDVSPHNILVSADGHVKVADFGVAKALGQMHSATSAGQLKGKLNYMAPEQVTGSAVDRRSDIFSLGCVLYEATTGLQPFKAEGDHQIMHRLLKGEFDPPSEVIEGYPEELEKIVLQAMAPQPHARFQTAEQLRNALEEWLAKSGPIITEQQISAVVASRVGDVLDRRKERIRAASTNPAERVEFTSDPPLVDSMTPSGRGRSNSGVKPAGFTPGGSLSSRPPPAMTSSSRPPPVTGSSRPPPVTGSSRPPPLPSMRSSVPSIPPPPPLPTRASMPTIAAAPRARMNSNPPLPLPVDPASAPTLVVDPEVLAAARELLPPAAPAQPSYFAAAAALGIVAAGALVAIGFFAWHALIPAAPNAHVFPDPSALIAAPAPKPSASQGLPSGEPVALSAEIAFKLVPDTATILVNGAELPVGSRAILRPKPGQTIDVVVRAPNHEAEKLIIDDMVPSPIELVLTPSPAPSAAAPTSHHRERDNRAAGDQGGDPKAPKPEAIPANPY